jgi:hypothetical protein
MFGLNTKPLRWSELHQTPRRLIELFPMFVLVAGALMALGSATLYAVYFAIDQFDYRVVSSRLVCAQPLNNRCSTHYSIREAGANAPTDYVTYGYQFAEGDLQPGNELRKTGIGFAYFVNERMKTWSHGHELSLWVLGALVALLISYRLRSYLPRHPG